MLRTYRLPLMLSPEERARLDKMRGSTSRSEFIRTRVFAPPPTGPLTGIGGEVYRHDFEMAAEAAQDAPGATIEAAPPPPAKDQLVLPPRGKADAHGWHMRYEDTGRGKGTLRMAKAGGDWLEVDLIGVELEIQADGTTVLRYGDRTLVRTGRSGDA